MKHRNRNLLVALLAAGVLVLSAFGGTALGHGHGGGGDPGSSAKAHGSGQPTHQVTPVKSPKASKSPKATSSSDWHLPKSIDCTKVPATSGTPAPTAEPTSMAVVVGDESARGFVKLASTKLPQVGRSFDRELLAQICSVENLRAASDKKIDKLIKSLQGLSSQVGKATLSAGDQAILNGEINGLVSDLQALKAKIDAETTLAGIQADLVTLSKDGVYARGISTQIRLIFGAEKAIAKGSQYDALAVSLAAQIAAAPSGIDTASAQTYLNDMKARLATAEGLVAPLPATLLAMTPTQLQAGKADPTLAASAKALREASFDFWFAGHDARVIQWILAGKPGFEGKHDKDKSPAPSVTPAPAATATPV